MRKAMHMRKVILLLLALLPTPAMATVTPDALRELVMAGDVAAVQAALAEAVAQDAGSGAEPDVQRELFGVFVTTHPDIGAFTEKWLQKDPASALAMTARAWHLYSVGWAIRGDEVAVHFYPAAMAEMREKHAESFALAMAATHAMPELIAASDAMLRLTPTLGKIEVVPLELERVFARQPNRGSLMRAMRAVSPQWGGRYDQLILLCDRYAPQITSVAHYDPDTCKIDGVYYGAFWNGKQREAAHQVLLWNANPILDYARLIDVVDGYGPPEHRLEVLTKLQSQRPLTVDEAAAFDSATAELNGPNRLVYPVQESKARLAEIGARRLAADRDPFNPVAVIGYINAIDGLDYSVAQPYPKTEIKERLRTLLKGAPYNDDAWRILGNIIAGSPTEKTGAIDRIDAAEPYFHNAIAYSNFTYSAVESALAPKQWAVVDMQNIMMPSDISALSKAERARLDHVVHCPMIWQMSMLEALCAHRSNGDDPEQCSQDRLFQPGAVMRMRQVVNEGSCISENVPDIEQFYKQPVKITP